MRFIKKFIFIFILFFMFTSVQAKTVNIYLFHSKECGHCASLIEFLDTIQDKYDIKIYKYEITTSKENWNKLVKAKEILKDENEKIEVPFTVIGNEIITGFNFLTPDSIENKIKYYSDKEYCDKLGVYLGKVEACEGDSPIDKEESSEITLPLIGKVDAKSFSLPIISAVIGLVDGFNPCAMWVLIFLLTMLIGMKNRKKMWILGLTFIISSALVYLAIMLAWLNLVVEFTTIRALQIIIAGIALIAASFNLYNFFKTLKKDDGCTVTNKESRKKIINRVKRIVALEEESENKRKFAFLLAILGMIVLALSVNVIELACSAGLPLIFTQILAMNEVTSLARLIYILIYILAFMFDDIVIFAIAMITFKITGISTKYTKYSHLIGGIIMLIIGLLMIFKPAWIMFNF
ncbi:MAG: hypothetical protein IJB71_05445 [Bacilli bacterium]|nr:hypothetical protein [Bacilli bacterium]